LPDLAGADEELAGRAFDIVQREMNAFADPQTARVAKQKRGAVTSKRHGGKGPDDLILFEDGRETLPVRRPNVIKKRTRQFEHPPVKMLARRERLPQGLWRPIPLTLGMDEIPPQSLLIEFGRIA